MPRVSVIIPTYNCSRYLPEAVESALAQTYQDYEIVIADDGSTDGTQELINRWDGRLVYAFQENRGLSAARNFAVSRASGEFLAYLDADDVWFPDKLERQVRFMTENRQCGLVHGDVSIIDEDGEVIHRRYNVECKRVIHQGKCLEGLIHYSTVVVPSVMERRACFEEVGGFDETLRSVEDYLHWVQIALGGHEFGYIEEPVAMYRWRSGSLSRNESQMTEAMVRVCRILLNDPKLRLHESQSVRRVLEAREGELQASLPYVYRMEGRFDLARKEAVRLIGRSPNSAKPYLELAKSFLPKWIARAVRSIGHSVAIG
jgi:glycosyltransferase involved in cell wall biosynthesis